MANSFQHWTLTVAESKTRFTNAQADCPIQEISFDNIIFHDTPEKIWFNLKLREQFDIFDLVYHSDIERESQSTSINGIDQTARILIKDRNHLVQVLNCLLEFYPNYYNQNLRDWMVAELHHIRERADGFAEEAYPGANAETEFAGQFANIFVQILTEYIQSMLEGDAESSPISMPEEGHNERRLAALGEQVSVPQEFICPLSRAIMSVPVSPRNHPEHIFERAWIQTALGRVAENPLNRAALNVDDLIPRSDIAARIDAFLSELEQAQPPILNHPSSYRNRKQRTLMEEAQAFVTRNGKDEFDPGAKRRRRGPTGS